MHPRTRVLAAAVAASLALVACGGDDATTDDPSSEPSSEASSPDAAGETVAVTAVDYAFQGLGTEYAAGTSFTLTNASEGEVHELVFVRLPDGEDRQLGELVTLPQEEIEALLAGVRLVSVAPPGGEGNAVVGDGTISEPGRYVVLCAIQVGVDPDAYFAEAQRMAEAGEEGPVNLEDGGPPHFTQGMITEVSIT